MRIYLLRHGEAESQAATDAQRRLTARGHGDNQSVAAQWAELQPVIAVSLVSPFVRAQQTFADFQELLPELQQEPCDYLQPEASAAELVDWLGSKHQQGDILLIGHNPLLSRVLALLTEGNTHTDRYLDTSQLVCVETEVVAAGCAVLKYTLTH